MIVERVNTAGGLSASRAGSSPLRPVGCGLGDSGAAASRVYRSTTLMILTVHTDYNSCIVRHYCST